MPEALRTAGTDALPRYCDVSLPVPLDQTFTYEMPETLRHRVKPGCRVIVPFGSRKLTGFALRVHSEPPTMETRQALRLVDEEPSLSEDLIALGRWIASYYCAPLGEVLRGMTPLASEVRRTKVYSLTDAGHDAARQMVIAASDEDPQMAVLRLLDTRPVSHTWLMKQVPQADKALKSLLRRGFVEVEDKASERDPMRAPSSRLLVEFSSVVMTSF